MPRPRKYRKVCALPRISKFAPEKGDMPPKEPVVLTVDEYETIRLGDYEEFTQEMCGQFMNVARTTVQQIYTEARKKIATVLVEGRPLKIEGGDYFLCKGKTEGCGRSRHCKRHRHAHGAEAEES